VYMRVCSKNGCVFNGVIARYVYIYMYTVCDAHVWGIIFTWWLSLSPSVSYYYLLVMFCVWCRIYIYNGAQPALLLTEKRGTNHYYHSISIYIYGRYLHNTHTQFLRERNRIHTSHIIHTQKQTEREDRTHTHCRL